MKGDKALSYALKPPKELLRMMKYDEEIKVGIEVSSNIMYKNRICNCSSYASSKTLTAQMRIFAPLPTSTGQDANFEKPANEARALVARLEEANGPTKFARGSSRAIPPFFFSVGRKRAE